MGDLYRATSQELAEVYRQTLERAAASERMMPKSDNAARPRWAEGLAKSQKALERIRELKLPFVAH